MAWVAVGVAAVSTTVAIVGQLNEASAKRDAQERNAELKRQQAGEMLRRQELNEIIARRNAEREAEEYKSLGASSGLGGTTLGASAEMKNRVDEELLIARRELEFKAGMLIKGAENDQQVGNDIMSAGTWGAIGTGTKFASDSTSYYMKYNKSNTPKDLPKTENRYAGNYYSGWGQYS